MARIETEVDIDIEDYLDVVKTEVLVHELTYRKDAVKELLKHKEFSKANINEFTIPEFKTPDEVLKYLKLVLKLKPWHGKDQIIAEIHSL